jgi:hypothetical protein
LPVAAHDLGYAAIVRAWVSDENGKNWKDRALVVLSAECPRGQDGRIVLACITGTFTADSVYVVVPSREVKGGHPATGLIKPSAVHCRWLRALDPDGMERIQGWMPESFMVEILRRVRRLNSTKLGDGMGPITPGSVATPGQTPRG